MECEFKECKEVGCKLVYDRESKRVMEVCILHADTILNYMTPEYIVQCENCSCWQGVN